MSSRGRVARVVDPDSDDPDSDPGEDEDEEFEQERSSGGKARRASSGRLKRSVKKSRSSKSSAGGGGEDNDDEDNNDEEDDEEQDGGAAFRSKRRGRHSFVFDPTDHHETVGKLMKLPGFSNKESDSWDGLSKDVKSQCLKALVRLLMTKAARGEPVTRANLSEVLGKVGDGAYKKHVSMAVNNAAQEVFSMSGFQLSSCLHMKGRKDEYILFSRLKSPKLQEVLAELSSNDAYLGFVFIVLQIINTASGRKLELDAILRQVRKIDNRFPDVERGGGSKKGDTCAVPELKDSFTGLIARMEKERYIAKVKDDAAKSSEDAKKIYELGPRFFAEFGFVQLAKTYYQGMGEEPDDGVLSEAKKLDADMVYEAKKEDEDEEEGGDA
jgi:hypothetical protein